MAQTTKNSDYRPNCLRTVFVTSVIDQAAAEKFTREAIPLLGSSDEPITLVIDSPGGSVFHAEGMYRTLKLANQDTDEKHRIITVGLNLAASAACDLLIAGDYALVYPHTVLLCHGVRQAADGLDVTRETALNLAKSLATSNEQFAMQLANNAISRFIFRFVTLRHFFESIRTENEKPELSDTSCFLHALQPHVSPDLMELLRQAMISYLDNDLIDINIREKLEQANPKPVSHVDFEAFILKCIIEYQVTDAADQSNWSFRANGIPQLESRFSILVSSHDGAHTDQIDRLVSRWGEFLLDKDESVEYSALFEEDKTEWLSSKVSPTLRSLWFFFVGICRLLQENENYLSASDAYWIGLVDEVIGRPELPNPRTLVEFSSELPID